MKPVDFIIACHSERRPVARAVASVLDGNADETNLIVVCHNIDVEPVRSAIAPEHRDLITFEHLEDGIRSASGPFEHGMESGEAEFVSIMGSDDTIQPGAVRSWLDLARDTGAEVVQTRLFLEGAPVHTPPVRPWLRGLADPVKDRLAYRSAPLGLVSRAARQRTGARLMPAAEVGGDVPYVTQLWFQTKVAVQRRGPGYVIHEGAGDRVTYEPRSVEREFRFLRELVAAPWYRELNRESRVSIVAKLLRIHVFGVVLNRPGPEWWTREQRAELAATASLLIDSAPGVRDHLSLADNRLIDAILAPESDAAQMIELGHARRRHGSPATLITPSAGRLLSREAPLRFMAASVLVR